MNPNSMIQPEDDVPVPVPYNFEDAAVFREFVMADEWEEVIKKYEEHVYFHKIRIKGRGTALHVAVSNGYIDHAKSLVNAIVMHDDQYGLRVVTERGDSPLHLAAYNGFKSMCECMIGKNGERKDLIRVKNAKGETPLFWAVLARHTKIFLYLHKFLPDDISIAMNNDGVTILHVAIRREKFGMANIIMHLHPRFASMMDKDGVLPLEDLATRTSAFKSGNNLSSLDKFVYDCVPDKVRDAKTRIKLYYDEGCMFDDVEDQEKADQRIPLYNVDELEKAGKVRHTLALLEFTAKILCYHIRKFVVTIWHIMSSSPRKRWPIVPKKKKKKRWPTQSPLGKIKIDKKKHIYGSQLLEAFMKEPYELSYRRGGADPFGDGELDEERKERDDSFERVGRLREGVYLQEREGNKKMEDSTKHGVAETMEERNAKVPKKSEEKGSLLVEKKNIETDSKKIDAKDTAYLLAAKYGIAEIMCALESKIKSVVHDTNSNNENALLLAVKNRQVHVVEGLRKRLTMEIFHSLSLEVDNNENTILHLVACTTIDNENTAWNISGAGVQMMWDIKWYEYIERLVPDHFHYRKNKEGKTPGEIFKEQHKELLQKSIEWLKETTESCAVVAALVAGVSFTTIGSVPGGNLESGKPTFEGKPAFYVFSQCSLLGFYCSANSLMFFLSILTCRKQTKDFSRSLPLMLLMVLGSLYVSIVFMFISFCGGHYFLLTDKYNKNGILFYLYLVVSFPVTFSAVARFPLYAAFGKVAFGRIPP